MKNKNYNEISHEMKITFIFAKIDKILENATNKIPLYR